MTEYQKDTAFLKRLILFDETAECRKLDEQMAQVQRDERCVKSAASLMVLFAALGAAGLAYGSILEDNFPYGRSQLIFNLLCALGLASLISLVVFSGLLLAYRLKMKHLRRECRLVVTSLLETHVGQPRRPSQGSHLKVTANEVAHGKAEFNGAPDRLALLRSGDGGPETSSCP